MSAIAIPCHKMKEWIVGGLIRLKYDTIKCALFRDLNINNTITTIPQIAALEIPADTSYQTGGIVVPDINVTTDVVTGKALLTCGAISYPNMNTTLTHAVVYSNKTEDGIVKPIVFFVAFDELVFENSEFRFQWPSAIFRW